MQAARLRLPPSDRTDHVKPGEAVPGRRSITVGLLLAMGVMAVETTVVTTALPTVVGELHELELFPWVFSAYLLASTVTIPLFGKLADLYGRRPVFLGGMAVLVAARAIQGLGAGAVMPLVFTIIGDVYPLEERGKVQGLISGLWGAA